MHRRKRFSIVCLLGSGWALAPTGCTVGPNYRPPEPRMPGSWSEVPSATQPAGEPGLVCVPTTQPCGELSQWWRTLADPQLDRLIERAFFANLDLRIAEERIREARAQRALAAGGLYPAVESSASYSRQEPSQNGAQARMISGPAALLGASTSNLGFELYQGAFNASWELDLFGGTRRNVEAAEAAAAATLEERRGVLVVLAADVARSYLELRGAQRRLAIAQANVAAQQDTLEVVRAKRSAGLVTELDVARASAQLSASRARLPLLTRQIHLAVHALSVLVTEDTAALGNELFAAAPLPPAPVEVPIGLPLELARRRPDIRRAERELAAATARVGAATAELYPRFTLVGTFGFEATRFENLGDWDSHTFGFGPGFRWPIFEGGRIRANIDAQDARAAQALARYERTVLSAVREVEDALIACTTEQSRRRALEDAVHSGREAVELARMAYEQGATDLLAVLDAQRTLYAAEDSLAEADQTVVTSIIYLYKALGGGWDVPQ